MNNCRSGRRSANMFATNVPSTKGGGTLSFFLFGARGSKLSAFQRGGLRRCCSKRWRELVQLTGNTAVASRSVPFDSSETHSRSGTHCESTRGIFVMSNIGCPPLISHGSIPRRLTWMQHPIHLRNLSGIGLTPCSGRQAMLIWACVKIGAPPNVGFPLDSLELLCRGLCG